jgi:hypothetical protein
MTAKQQRQRMTMLTAGDGGQADRLVRRYEDEAKRLRRQNRHLEHALGFQRAKNRDLRLRLEDAEELAGICERRYIAICALLRMVLSEFDEGTIDGFVRPGQIALLAGTEEETT